jgi:hypothetical protein
VVDPGGSGFETYSGSPSGPLTLAFGAASTGIKQEQGTAAGLTGGTGALDIGEGVVALLFDFNIVELGLEIIGAGDIGAGDIGGTTTFFFYDSDGGLVDTITTALIGSLTFTSTQSFRGVAIENTDPGGQGYDNLRFDATVPEPTTFLLLGLGLAGLGLRGSGCTSPVPGTVWK